MEKKEMIIAVGVTIGAALLVLFMKHSSNGQAAGGTGTGGTSDIVGGFTSASTVFVPTSSYDLNFNTYKGAVSYSTVTNNSQSETTTTYAPVNSPINSPSGSDIKNIIAQSPVVGLAAPPTITGSGTVVVNIPTQQTNTAPVAPVAAAPPPPPSTPTWEQALSGMHYATPRGGWNPNSVVDNLKSHGYNADMAHRQQLASSMGIQGYQGTAAQNVQMLNTLKAAGL